MRPETIVTALAILVIVAALPSAIVDTTLLAAGIILDVVFQLVIYGAVHPGAALLVGPILICFPYALSGALTTRLARRVAGH